MWLLAVVAVLVAMRTEAHVEGRNPLAGAVAANLSPAVADELGMPANTEGVAIVKLEGGPARRFFKRGDIVLEINGVMIDSVDALRKVLESDARLWRIAIDRGGRIMKLAVGG